MPEVFLTGGTGFIGGALADRLVTDGRSVRALARSESSAAPLRSRGISVTLGDINDEDALVAGMTGCTTVFHVAGLNTMCLSDPSRLERVNVAGTRTVVRAAARCGVDRVVYTSSASTIGEPSGTVGTESTHHRGTYVSPYERSKHLAEVAAFGDAASAGVDLVAVNPSSVQGPGRSRGTARILISYLRGRLRFAANAQMSLVYIDDVVEAHLRAEHLGVPGQRYLVSGWTTTVADAITMLAKSSDRAPRVRYVPSWVLYGASAMIGGWYRLRRRDAPLCPEMVRTLRHGHALDGSLIEREWGISYTPPQEWLATTVDWYQEQGLI